MGFRSFKGSERENNLTLPNAISIARGIGGTVFGVLLATGHISPDTALLSVGVLGASDAEGSLITITNSFPRIQNFFRIWPTRLGKKLDVAGDKAFVLSTLIGGAIGGEIPTWQAVGIGATELATATTTLAITKITGKEPDVSKIGTFGMILRAGALITDLCVTAFSGHPGLTREILQDGSDITAATAIALGALSCRTLIHDYYPKKPTPELT